MPRPLKDPRPVIGCMSSAFAYLDQSELYTYRYVNIQTAYFQERPHRFI